MSDHHHHHDHDHAGHDDHHHGGGAHDHSNDITPALQYSLYKQIDFDNIVTLNEATPGSGAAVVKKEWSKRLEDEPEVESDADEQLLMHIPFTGQIKLHSLLIRTSTTPSAPSVLSLFRNRTDLDFSTASDTPSTQTLNVPQSNDVIEMPLNRAQWNMTTSIDLFFESNHGDDEDVTRVAYLGFKGEWMNLNREPVTFLYEAAARPSDHKVIQGIGMGMDHGMQGGR